MTQKSESERRAIVLRTSASIMEGALGQMQLLGEEYPRYQKELENVGNFFRQVIADAREVGFIERPVRSRKGRNAE